jgi:hypothetical protein
MAGVNQREHQVAADITGAASYKIASHSGNNPAVA